MEFVYNILQRSCSLSRCNSSTD